MSASPKRAMDSNGSRTRARHHDSGQEHRRPLQGLLINIVDTPGHADFGGEVERTLSMVDGVMLLVDASEGPLPQTRFVLRKALERRLTPIVVDQQDRSPDARAQEVLNEIYDLFIDLDAAKSSSISPSSTPTPRKGPRRTTRMAAGTDLRPLFDAIVQFVPPPKGNPESPLQLLVANLDSSDYVGRIAIGRIFNGRVKIGDDVVICKLDSNLHTTRVTKLYAFDGLKRVDIQEAAARWTSSASPASRTSPSARPSPASSIPIRSRRLPSTSRPCR
jgi:GTP-binding protein